MGVDGRGQPSDLPTPLIDDLYYNTNSQIIENKISKTKRNGICHLIFESTTIFKNYFNLLPKNSKPKTLKGKEEDMVQRIKSSEGKK